MNKIQTWTGVLFGLLALLISCGGDGGGDGGGQGPVAITAANQITVAETGAGSVSFTAELTEIGELLIEALSSLPPAPRQAARIAAAEVPGFCDAGTLDIEIDDVAPLDVLSTGDSSVATFSQCDRFDGFETTTFNGAVTFSVTAASAESVGFPDPPFDLDFAFSLGNFTGSDIESTTTINGGFALNLASDDGTVLTAGLSGSSLSVSDQGSDGSFSATLSDFNAVTTVNEVTEAYSLDASGSVTTSDLGGSVSYDTTTPFSGPRDDNPDTGVLVITGANGSTLTLIAEDSNNVTLELDADGDGTPEQTTPTTWDALDF